MDRSLMKERAKELLRNRYWMCVGVCILPIIIQGFTGTSGYSGSDTNVDAYTDMPAEFFSEGLMGFSVFSIIFALFFGFVFSFLISAFVTNQLTVGGCRYFLKYRKNNPVEFSEIFRSYKDKTFINIAKVTICRDIFVSLWSVLFVIPGIIKSLEYWAIDYILSVRPDMERKQAFELSRRLTNGHKMELFILELSFLGWNMLSLFTFSLVGVFYATPYIRLTYTEYFAYLRSEAIRQGIITPYDIPDYQEYVPASPYYPYCPPEANYTPENPAQPQAFSQPIIQPDYTANQPTEPYCSTTDAATEVPAKPLCNDENQPQPEATE